MPSAPPDMMRDYRSVGTIIPSAWAGRGRADGTDPTLRLAVSGAHRTGKSTLVEDLDRSLPGYEVIEEPYVLLEETGHVFRHPPSLEDFELQLNCSIRSILDAPSNAILDRCPADLLAYLALHRDHERFDPDSWMPQVRQAMGLLDLVVFVPVERADRISLDLETRPRWRRAVDEELRALLLDDPWGWGAPTLEVRGDPGERLAQVLKRLAMPF